MKEYVIDGRVKYIPKWLRLTGVIHEHKLPEPEPLSKPVGKYTLEGVLVTTFKTMYSATEDSGVAANTFTRHVKHHSPIGNYVYKLLGDRNATVIK